MPTRKPATTTTPAADAPQAAPVPAAKKKAPAKTAVKPVAKSAAKTAVKASGKPGVKQAEPSSTAAAPKPKQRLVRDSFTMPKAEYAAIDELKRRAAKLEQPVKKSELLRAGIKALSGLPDAALLAALKAVPTLKTGRPKHK